MKRLLACLLGGVICAGLCVMGGTIINGELPDFSFMLSASILNRILIGFVIGISGLKKMNYILHGAVIGFLVTITAAVSIMSSNTTFFIIYTFAGIVYGIIIELIATKLFKAGIA